VPALAARAERFGRRLHWLGGLLGTRPRQAAIALGDVTPGDARFLGSPRLPDYRIPGPLRHPLRAATPAHTRR